MGETIVESHRGIAQRALQHIRGIASDDRVFHVEFKRHVVVGIVVGKGQGGTTVGVEWIELRQGAMVHGHTSTLHQQTVAQRVGQLAIVERGVDVAQFHTIAVAVVHDGAEHGKL